MRISKLPLIKVAAIVGLFAGSFALYACGGVEWCVPEGSIVAGKGVALNGASVCLDQTATEVEKNLGKSQAKLDLGKLGTQVTYPEHNITLLFSGPKADAKLIAIYLEQGVAAKTQGGLGIGSSQELAKTDLGEPTMAPFIDAWWYKTKGITVKWQDGKASRIQIFLPPKP